MSALEQRMNDMRQVINTLTSRVTNSHSGTGLQPKHYLIFMIKSQTRKTVRSCDWYFHDKPSLILVRSQA